MKLRSLPHRQIQGTRTSSRLLRGLEIAARIDGILGRVAASSTMVSAFRTSAAASARQLRHEGPRVTRRRTRNSMRERHRTAGKLILQKFESLRIVDIVPGRHIDDRHRGFARTLQRQAIDVRRAPRDIEEQVRVNSRQADQRIATVKRRTEHHRIATLRFLHRLLQDRRRQCRTVRIDQDRTRMVHGQKIGQRGAQAHGEIAVHLRVEAKRCRQHRAQHVLAAARGIDRKGRDAGQPGYGLGKIADETGGNVGTLAGRKRRREARLGEARGRRLAQDADRDGRRMVGHRSFAHSNRGSPCDRAQSTRAARRYKPFHVAATTIN